MKRVPFISGLLLLAGLGLSALAFHPILPFFRSSSSPAASITPTNLPGGFSAFTWYEPSISGYFTNASVATLSNLTSFGSIYDLTNNGAGGTFPVKEAAKLNGLDTLYFSGLGSPPRLFARAWTNYTPFEVVMVVSLTNTGTKRILSDVPDVNGATWAFTHSGVATMSLGQGAGSITSLPLTNKYFVVNLVYSNASSVIYTNLVVAKAASTGATGTNAFGLMIGCDTQPANGEQMSVVSLCTFTNQLLTAAAQLALYQYYTNRYNLGP